MPALEKGLVTTNQPVGELLYEMEIIAPKIARQAQPGQFVHVRPASTYDPLLRRPLSLYDVNHQLGSITLLYKVVGRGTALLSQVKSREQVDIMGPLGRGFTLLAGRQKALLVGGGVGTAPLIYLARVLQEQGHYIKAAYGAASAQEAAVFARKFNELGVEAWPATMDGSLGYKGTVVGLLQNEPHLAKADRIYCCGPEKMMEAVTAFARRNHVKGEVSLEEAMACGVGACLGCARKLNPQDNEYVKVCKDGPVFDMDLL
ncbi:MAG: dihydroorotate dehydrogenase electron transfer subunit [Syntrophomonadaceae bacterium]|nr:dihydroorotate dehydrogenase electron transfer subunit [Syntrophomonadaceae bacterium]